MQKQNIEDGNNVTLNGEYKSLRNGNLVILLTTKNGTLLGDSAAINAGKCLLNCTHTTTGESIDHTPGRI